MTTLPQDPHRRPTILTVVLNYKTAEMTLRSVETAREAMQNLSGAIIIVENDSQDGSFETITKHVQEAGWDKDGAVQVIQSGHNGGFGAGNNVGIEAGLPDGSSPDYVYILNSDAFPTPDAIEVLMAHLEAHPNTVFAGSSIHDEHEQAQQTAFRFPSIISEFENAIRIGVVSRLFKNFRVPMDRPTETTPVNWVAGASVLMRRSALEEFGTFDETFFLYFEEVDLCIRAARAGYRTDYVPASRVVHIGSVSTGMKKWTRVPAYWYASRWHYFVKNHGKLYATTATLARLVGGALNNLRCLITGKSRGTTPGFLTTLALHDLRALTRRQTSSKALQKQRPHVS